MRLHYPALLFLSTVATSLLYGQTSVALDPTGKFLINASTGQPIWLQGDSPQGLAVQVSNADVDSSGVMVFAPGSAGSRRNVQ